VEITREKVGDVTVVTLQADSLDAGNTNEFKRSVSASIESKAKVVLDLSPVKFVDSTGCGAILAYLRQLTAAGGDLKLCSITKPVRVLFELVRLHKIFEIFNTREEAIKAYQV
jgi:anti-sigma B factor antagonist